MRERDLGLAAQVQPGQLEGGPEIGAKERHLAREAQLVALGLARQRKQQAGVVLVDVCRGLAQLRVFGGVHAEILKRAAPGR
ncbi:hypothetical protein D3C86_1958600 [compost metagenome]